MEVCYNCGEAELIEMDDGVSCSQCSRSQNTVLFRSDVCQSTGDNEFYIILSSMLSELSHRLGMSQKSVISIEKRLLLLKGKKSSYTSVQIVSSLHYIEELENESCVSPLMYTLMYNGCIDCKTLEKCTKYLSNLLNINQSIHALNWDSLIEPYVTRFKLDGKDVGNIILYCNKMYNSTGMSIFTIASMSVILYCEYCKKN